MKEFSQREANIAAGNERPETMLTQTQAAEAIEHSRALLDTPTEQFLKQFEAARIAFCQAYNSAISPREADDLRAAFVRQANIMFRAYGLNMRLHGDDEQYTLSITVPSSGHVSDMLHDGILPTLECLAKPESAAQVAEAAEHSRNLLDAEAAIAELFAINPDFQIEWLGGNSNVLRLRDTFQDSTLDIIRDMRQLPEILRRVQGGEDIVDAVHAVVAERAGVMTNKEFARQEQMGTETLLYFMKQGWVDAPKLPNQWTAAEAAQAHINIRETIAYQRGWLNCKRGYALTDKPDFSV